MELKRRSIFLKLIGITFATGILVNGLLYFGIRGFLQPPPQGREIVEQNVRAYVNQLAQEIGDPPNMERMRSISQRTGLGIYTEGPLGVYTSEPGLPTPQFDKKPERPERPYVTVKTLRTRYAFYMPERLRWDPGYEFILGILLLVTGLLLISYFAIRRLLAPLHDLALGADMLGKGAVGHRVPVKNQDEFGQLAAGFNHMSTRIEQMIRSKERLLLDVSHELQSPLARMKMALELLQDEKGRGRLQRDVKEMETMVAEILESARLDSSPGALRWQRVELVGLVEDQLQLYREQKPAVVLHSEASAVWIRLDPARFVTVLRNLIDNALKYSEPQGPSVEIQLSEKADRIECAVRDAGRGIPPEEIPHLFEPFYRIDKSRSKKTGGYGLGLSLCERIIQAHGGSIRVENRLQAAGTVVTVSLPLTR